MSKLLRPAALVAAGLLISASFPALAADEAPIDLITPATGRAPSAAIGKPYKAATAVDVAASALAGAKSINITLPGLGPVTLGVTDRARHENGSLSARATSGEEVHVYATLVEHDGKVVGIIHADKREFRLENTPSGAVLYELDTAAIRHHPKEPMAPRLSPMLAPSPGTAADDGSVIELLVLYSTDGKAGVSDPLASAQLVVDDANGRYANSGVQTRLHLAGWDTIAYTGSRSLDTDLRHVTADADAQAKRDTAHADLVQLIVGGSDDGYAGIAWIGPSDAYGYSVIGSSYITWAAAHEIGHNQGDLHNRENDSRGTYNHGYCDPAHNFHTTMSYYCSNSEVVIPYFSTPDRTYNGAPIGDAV